jgi:hypothetical protein
MVDRKVQRQYLGHQGMEGQDEASDHLATCCPACALARVEHTFSTVSVCATAPALCAGNRECISTAAHHKPNYHRRADAVACRVSLQPF